jgi:hypothetical protein
LHTHTTNEDPHAEVGGQERGMGNWETQKQTEVDSMEQTRMANNGSIFINKMGVQM